MSFQLGQSDERVEKQKYNCENEFMCVKQVSERA